MHHWHGVPCDFDLLIVNIGDMLEEASGGDYPSTVHRVLIPTGVAAIKSRISLPPIGVVLISQNHYDHLCDATLGRLIASGQKPRIFRAARPESLV